MVVLNQVLVLLRAEQERSLTALVAGPNRIILYSYKDNWRYSEVQSD